MSTGYPQQPPLSRKSSRDGLVDSGYPPATSPDYLGGHLPQHHNQSPNLEPVGGSQYHLEKQSSPGNNTGAGRMGSPEFANMKSYSKSVPNLAEKGNFARRYSFKNCIP